MSWSVLLSIIGAETRLESFGLQLLNPSGLLNLVAWARTLGGHLVPQDIEPLAPEQPGLVLVDQNLLLQLRQEYQQSYAERRVRNTDGQWVVVQKAPLSCFPEDNQAAFYISKETINRKRLEGVYLSETRSWWLQIDAASGSSAAAIYNYWGMLKTWLCRIVPVIEAELPGLPTGTFLFNVRFGHLSVSRTRQGKTLSEDEIRSAVTVNPNRLLQTLRSVVSTALSWALSYAEPA